MKRLSSVSRSAPSISLPHVMRQHLGFFKSPENVPVENLLICPLTPPPSLPPPCLGAKKISHSSRSRMAHSTVSSAVATSFDTLKICMWIFFDNMFDYI